MPTTPEYLTATYCSKIFNGTPTFIYSAYDFFSGASAALHSNCHTIALKCNGIPFRTNSLIWAFCFFQLFSQSLTILPHVVQRSSSPQSSGRSCVELVPEHRVHLTRSHTKSRAYRTWVISAKYPSFSGSGPTPRSENWGIWRRTRRDGWLPPAWQEVQVQHQMRYYCCCREGSRASWLSEASPSNSPHRIRPRDSSTIHHYWNGEDIFK